MNGSRKFWRAKSLGGLNQTMFIFAVGYVILIKLRKTYSAMWKISYKRGKQFTEDWNYTKSSSVGNEDKCGYEIGKKGRFPCHRRRKSDTGSRLSARLSITQDNTGIVRVLPKPSSPQLNPTKFHLSHPMYGHWKWHFLHSRNQTGITGFHAQLTGSH